MGDYWKHQLDGFDFTNPLESKAANDASYGHASVRISSDLADAFAGVCQVKKYDDVYYLVKRLCACAPHVYEPKRHFDCNAYLNRYEPEFKNCIGVFTNVIPIRVEMKPQLTLDEHIKNVTSQTIGELKINFISITIS